METCQTSNPSEQASTKNISKTSATLQILNLDIARHETRTEISFHLQPDSLRLQETIRTMQLGALTRPDAWLETALFNAALFV